MDVAEFVARHPVLFHMAADGSWPLIREDGLLTTRQQVERCGPSAMVAQRVLCQRRSEIIVLEAPDGASVSIRDQKPLLLHNLRLVGTDLQGWLDVLNNRVFFWANEAHLNSLLNARAYRSHPHHVITIDTARLLARHGDRVRLSAINSGATIFPTSPDRGPATFTTIQDFAHSPRGSRARRPIVEVAVLDGVPDIAQFTVGVRRVQGDATEVLYP